MFGRRVISIIGIALFVLFFACPVESQSDSFGVSGALAEELKEDSLGIEQKVFEYFVILNTIAERSLYKPSAEEFSAIHECIFRKAFSENIVIESCFSEAHVHFGTKNNVNESPDDIKNSVIAYFNPDSKLGYLRINSFGESKSEGEILEKEILRFLMEFEKGGAEALILDLRSNSGGLLRLAIDLLNNFAPEAGIPIITTISRRADFKEHTIYVSWNRGRFSRWKIMILVNQETASAAEIVAGVLQNWGARVISNGTKTYGKGKIQAVFALSDNGNFFSLTTAEVLLGGKPLDKAGITPDVVVPNGDSETLLDEALKRLKK